MYEGSPARPIEMTSFRTYLRARPPTTGVHEFVALWLIENLPNDLRSLSDLHHLLNRNVWDGPERVIAIELHRGFRNLRKSVLPRQAF